MASKEYETYIKKANSYFENGEYDKAIIEYEKAFEIEIYSNDYIDLIICYLNVKDYANAETAIKTYISYENRSGLGYFYYGELYFFREQIDKALVMYLVSEVKGLKEIDLYFKIAYCFHELSDKDDIKKSLKKKYISKAIKYYKKVLKIDPSEHDSQVNLAIIYEKQKKLKKALKIALEIRKYHPDENKICFNIGNIYYHLGDMKKMEEFYLEEMTKPNPTYLVYYNLAIQYTSNKEYNKAINYYIKGLDINKDDYRLWYNLACVYALNNQFKNALECFHCSALLNDKTLEYIETDDELENFRNSKEYIELKNEG